MPAAAPATANPKAEQLAPAAVDPVMAGGNDDAAGKDRHGGKNQGGKDDGGTSVTFHNEISSR